MGRLSKEGRQPGNAQEAGRCFGSAARKPSEREALMVPSTNGHGPRRAILYARVSTDEQARSGYSLAQQIEALRDYAAREGYEVYRGGIGPRPERASLERPGMDRVRTWWPPAGSRGARPRPGPVRRASPPTITCSDASSTSTRPRCVPSTTGATSPRGGAHRRHPRPARQFERAKTARGPGGEAPQGPGRGR
jgi:hypothetical protein